MVGFHGLEPPKELTDWLKHTTPAGLIVFSRNVESSHQVATLIRTLRACWPNNQPTDFPLFAVDQEGGPVRRLKAPQCPDILPLPPARLLGQHDEPAFTKEVSRALGAQLAALGFNLNFAPVLDVDSNPENPIIGKRAYGCSPEPVIRHGLAVVNGLLQSGVIPCGKHFPGHGDTDLDSHLALPRLALTKERLSSQELRPFQAVIQAAIPAIMSAHIVYETLDPDWPATLSPTVLPTLLRNTLGFNGVVISDDLEMAAIKDHFSAKEIAVQGLKAGIDIFLVCHTLELATELLEAIKAEALRCPQARSALHRASERVKALKGRALDHATKPWAGELPNHPQLAKSLARLNSDKIKPG